jgi:hypothetical protein
MPRAVRTIIRRTATGEVVEVAPGSKPAPGSKGTPPEQPPAKTRRARKAPEPEAAEG